MKKIATSLLVLISLSLNAGTITVTNVNDSGLGSLRGAINTANSGDTIRFLPNLIVGGNDTIKLNSIIPINKSLVFKGLYNIIDTLFISGQKANGIFQFDLTSTVKNITIDSLSLIRGKSNFHGGAIYFNGDSLFVYNSSLTDNEGINGGAIYSNLITAKMIINNSCINNNKAGNGGGIYSKSLFDSSICITNSFINDNEVSTDGGGVYGVSIIVDNSEINNNRAYNGAGIYSDINYATSFLAINNSELAFNFVTNKGAGIYVGALNMKNTVLHSDTAVYGGALYISAPSQSITMISNSTLYNNYAGIGGAIYSIPSDSSFLTIDSSVIRNNYGHHGAGINVTTSIKSVTKILNSEVINNTSFQYGGGVNLSNLHNYTNLQLLVKNTVIKNNEATIQGGGIYCQTTGTTDSSKIVVEIDSSVIDSNLSNNGGGIFIIARADFNSKAISIIDVKNSTISNNVALTNGGGIFVESNTTGSGGTVAESESTVNINTSTITSNLAGLKGGGIYAESNSNTSSSSQVKLINTTMVYNGGGVYNYTTSPGLDTSEMIIESSILALNGTSLFSDTLISLGYNVFSDATVLGSIITDQLNVDSMMLNLGSLQNNGGLTFTLIPGVGSVAVDMGSPSDFSDAQNNSITGIRDVGAAESGITVEVSKNEIITNFNIYPNPNNGKFEVLIDDVQGEVMLELINLLGEVVYKDTGKKSKYSFDLTNQSKGVYFLKIKVGAKRGMQKIIFQ